MGLDFCGSKELDDLIQKDFATVMSKNYILRLHRGYFAALHVYAYLSGKEPIHSDPVSVEVMRCINAICESLGVCTMYKVNESCDLEDYGFNDFTDRPIVTDELLSAAAEKFPVDISMHI